MTHRLGEEITVYPSAARTEAPDEGGRTFENDGFGAARVTVNISANATGGVLTLWVDGYDAAGYGWFNLLTYLGLDEVGTTSHLVSGLPRKFRVKVGHADTKSVTYSVGLQFLPAVPASTGEGLATAAGQDAISLKLSQVTVNDDSINVVADQLPAALGAQGGLVVEGVANGVPVPVSFVGDIQLTGNVSFDTSALATHVKQDAQTGHLSTLATASAAQATAAKQDHLETLLPAALGAHDAFVIEGVASGTAVPVSGTVTAEAGTGPYPVSDNGGSLTVDNAALAKTGGGNETDVLRVTIANNSSGVVSVDDGDGVLSVNDAAGSLTVDSPQLPAALGQAAMAASLPVVLASNQSAVVVSDGGGAGSLTVDNATLAVTANGTDTGALRVTVASNSTGQIALAAGTAGIGKLTANSGVDIGDVDVTSVIPGTGATNLGKAEDAAHTSGDVGVLALAVRNDAGTALAGTTGDYIALTTDANGDLRMVMRRATGTAAATVAQDAATSDAVDLGGYAIAAIMVPAGFDGTQFSFTASDTVGGTYVAVIDDQNNALTVTCAASRMVVDAQVLSKLAGLRFIKIVCATTQTTTSTVFTLILKA